MMESRSRFQKRSRPLIFARRNRTCTNWSIPHTCQSIQNELGQAFKLLRLAEESEFVSSRFILTSCVQPTLALRTAQRTHPKLLLLTYHLLILYIKAMNTAMMMNHPESAASFLLDPEFWKLLLAGLTMALSPVMHHLLLSKFSTSTVYLFMASLPIVPIVTYRANMGLVHLLYTWRCAWRGPNLLTSRADSLPCAWSRSADS